VTDNWSLGIGFGEDCINNVVENNIEENNNLGDPRDPGIQDDAGLGRDATNSDPGDFINWGRYSGFLFNEDIHDYYQIQAKAGIALQIKLESPAGSDFDFILVGDGIWQMSNKFGNKLDEMFFTPEENGYLAIHVHHWEGEGIYWLEVSERERTLPFLPLLLEYKLHP
jgi:hypothetical protein